MTPSLRLLASLTLATGATAPPLLAQVPGKIAFETYQLPNGLTVILSAHHAAQVAAVDVWYDVGSRNERPGRTGFAHLFEHMMFQGSDHVKKSEHLQLVERAGGSLNGQTEDDITRYYETLPSNRLNLGLWLEADRMRSLAITDSTFRNQREVVKEERRVGLDNQPYTGAFLDGLYAVYDSATCFPYAHPTIGSFEDLDSAKTEDIAAFFKTFYAPNNARLVVTGDFDPAETKRLIADYFGDIPKADPPPAVTCQTDYSAGIRRRNVTDKLAALPAVARFFRVPPHGSAEAPALELLAIILGQGESARLNRRIGREARAAASTQAGIFEIRRGPQVFATIAVANQGVTADSLDGLLAAEIARLSTEGVTEDELAKAKNIYRAGLISERQRAIDIAEDLHHAATFHGTPEAVNTDFDRYLAVTLDQVRRAAQTYLTAANTLVLTVVPANAS